MRPTRSSLRRATTGLAAGILVVGSLVAAPAAQAAPLPDATPDSAMALADRLGDRTAGTYKDAQTGRMVVTITDASAADEVRAAGAVARVVTHSAAQLRSATAVLDRSIFTPGTGWHVDPVTNKVVISVDETVTGAKLARVEAVAKRLGAVVSIERLAGTLSTTISGGQAIYTGGSRCSLGFNVRSGSTYYFLTAGHCTNIGSTWYANSSGTSVLGTRAGSSFPGNDYGIVRYSIAAQPGDVYLYGSGYRDITRAATPAVGTSVSRSGSTTGVRSGSVTGLNATVNYSQGRVSGLIRTNVCAQPGDSGGSLFSGTTAHGLTSGGSGNCSTGGTTYFQTVTEALSAYGVSVY